MGDSFYRQLRAMLLEAGCTMIRQGKGSHEIWYSPITDKTISVPSNIKVKPTANAILRQAGIDRRI